ncbi:MAG: cell division protein FtsQ/DivIB [Clostridia bacterium]|nr:cell division protein FtsQ/DivIB [Clostridia bacterium]MBR6809406.1 cell division protein FtsQ/DivIB [Clostridia bacterium]
MSQQTPQDFVPWMPQEETPPPPKRTLKPGVKAAFICLAAILVAVVVLFGGLFRIRTITVVAEGGMTESQEKTAIEWSGVEEGMSYFSVSEKKVRASMEKNRYLICQRVEKFLPGTVVLYVQHRYARANVHVLGVTYLLDENGMVLEKLTGSMDDRLPVVTGMQTREVDVGKSIVAGSEEQLNAYRAVIGELLSQGWVEHVSELKVSDPDSLYMLTAKGYTVHLGNTENLRAKIGTVRAVEEELLRMGHKDGVIEASVPAVATYTPVD